MRRIFFGILLVSIASLFLNSCKTKNHNPLTFDKGKNGVLYHIYYKSGDTIHPKLSDLVFINMRYYLPDTVLFDSKNLNDKLMFPMIKPLFKGDLYDGLKIMSEGDSMTFKVVADSFFLKTANMKQLPAYVKPGTPMYFDVKLNKIETQQQYKDEQKEKEQKILQKYIKDNNITAVPTSSGLYFIPLKKGKGRKPVKGDICGVYLKVQTIDGTVLWDKSDEMIDIEFGKPFDTKGLMEGLSMIREGGKARLIVPSDIGVGSEGRPPAVKPYTTVIYDVTLAKFKTLKELNEERKEKALKKAIEHRKNETIEYAKIKNYLKNHHYNSLPDSNGIYHIVLKKGDGPYPTDTSHMQLFYKMSDINGNIIQSNYNNNTPFTFQMGTHSIIRGWEMGLKKMRQGEKALIIVPSIFAYGTRGRGNQIKPYSPLLFEVKLVKVY